MSRSSSTALRGALVGASIGLLAGALLATSLLRLNDVQTNARSVGVLCAVFAAIHGLAGAIAGAAVALVGHGLRRAPRSQAAPDASHVHAWIAGAFLTVSVGVVGIAISGSAPGPEDPVPSIPTARAAAAGTPRLLLIGVDGLDWVFTQDMLAAGELSNLAAMRERGFGGPLESIEPSLSPLVGTSIATGVTPARHGVLGFEEHVIHGVDASFVRLVPYVGMWRLLTGLERIGLAERVPIGADACRVPRFWEVANRAGRRVAAVHWWATWPTESVDGWLVTDRFYDLRNRALGMARVPGEIGTVHPPVAQAELARLRIDPDAVSPAQIRRFLDSSDDEIAALGTGEFEPERIESEFRFVLSMDETVRGVVLKVLRDEDPPDLAAAYLRGVDILSHAALQYSDLVGGAARGTPDELAKYGAAVRRYYQYIDEIIGEWIEAAGSGTTVLVVSGHGFEKLADGSWGHAGAPAGVLFAAGGLVKRGADARGASVYDVAPTVLYLAGLPVADDLVGVALRGLVKPDHLARVPVRSVTTFGRRVRRTGGQLYAADDEELRQLRGLEATR